MLKRRLNRSLRATFLGLGANVLLAAGKLVTGLIGNSQALVADAVESLADLISSVVVWRGLVVAAAPADEDHPYGHGKAEPIAAAAVAGMLIAVAVGIAVGSLHQLGEPRDLPEAFTLYVLIVVILVKEGLYRYVASESSVVGSVAMRSDAWHHRSDAITSLAALIGIAVALLGGKELAYADNVAALLAAAIIAWNGFRLLRPALDELMDTRPDSAVTGRIREIARSTPGISGVEKCLVRKMGYQLYVDMHVEVEPSMTVEEAHWIAHKVKDRVCQLAPDVCDVLVHIEPSRRTPPGQRVPPASASS